MVRFLSNVKVKDLREKEIKALFFYVIPAS